MGAHRSSARGGRAAAASAALAPPRCDGARGGLPSASCSSDSGHSRGGAPLRREHADVRSVACGKRRTRTLFNDPSMARSAGFQPRMRTTSGCDVSSRLTWRGLGRQKRAWGQPAAAHALEQRLARGVLSRHRIHLPRQCLRRGVAAALRHRNRRGNGRRRGYLVRACPQQLPSGRTRQCWRRLAQLNRVAHGAADARWCPFLT